MKQNMCKNELMIEQSLGCISILLQRQHAVNSINNWPLVKQITDIV